MKALIIGIIFMIVIVAIALMFWLIVEWLGPAPLVIVGLLILCWAIGKAYLNTKE